MIFKTMLVDDAVGTLLAHSIHAKDAIYKKGRLLTEDDLAALKAAGIQELTVARLEKTDVSEDEAAYLLATSVAGSHVTCNEPFTGRSNLYAVDRGLIVVNAEAINRFNAIDESVTLATLSPFEMVAPRNMLATIKIIPFAVSRDVLDHAHAITDETGPLIDVAPFHSKRISLISTELDGTNPTILDKTRAVIHSRIEELDCTLHHEARCAHQPGEIARAVRACHEADCDIILIFGASAIVDRRDAIPQGVVEAGGEIRHFGMPVDPGNLLLLASFENKPVVGLPGCARSPKINSLDWVLRRLVADIDVGPIDLVAMGVGGLLKEIPSRPQPRNTQEKLRASDPPSAPRICALVLAAGQSRRMGDENKLLANIDGSPMIRRVTEAIRSSQVDRTLIVTGFESELVRGALSGLAVTFVGNPNFNDGLSTSLRVGIDAMDSEFDGVLICLGDMPGVSTKHIDRLIAAFDPNGGRSICVPTHKGKRGNPVLWGRQLFEQLGQVSGDVGAKHLI